MLGRALGLAVVMLGGCAHTVTSNLQKETCGGPMEELQAFVEDEAAKVWAMGNGTGYAHLEVEVVHEDDGYVYAYSLVPGAAGGFAGYVEAVKIVRFVDREKKCTALFAVSGS